MKTEIIRYSLGDRGRVYRGTKRNFPISRIVGQINGPVCQERVKNRDMLGYYGHWPRLKFGLNPSEGGLEKGKPAFVEPAIVTVKLKAYPDGTIEHQEEFLDTDTGKLAAKLYQSRVGGFSSVITPDDGKFFGFDFVNEPNYTTNRGYALDSVNFACLPQNISQEEYAAACYGAQIRGILIALDAAEAKMKVQEEAIKHLQAENADLVGMCAANGVQAEKKLALDGIKPYRATLSAREQLQRDAALFDSIKELPQVESGPQTADPPKPAIYRMLHYLHRN